MIKRFILVSAALGLSFVSLAQHPSGSDPGFRRRSAEAVHAELQADPLKYGGIYYVNDFSDRDLTPAPKGYKPFYVSSYARHGARYILDESQYTRLHTLFSRAGEEGNLTPFGEKTAQRFEALYPALKNRAGELTPLGKRQHRDLGRRMIANYPEVFKGKARVHAFSTEVPRTIQSMGCFLESLREGNPSLDIVSEVSLADKHFLNPQSKDHRYVSTWYWETVRNAGTKWRREDYEPMREARIDARGILSRLFMDVDKALAGIPAHKAVDDLFFFALNMPCLPLDGNFMDIFTDSDLYAIWECDNYEYYVEKGPGVYSLGYARELGAYMLDDILTRAEEDIASGAYQADLRFGHDGCIMSLMTFMNIGCWNETVPGPQAQEVWQSQNVPMAANLQLIFYRNRKGNILVKPLYDEKNLVLPIPPAEGPYYRWTEVLAYYRPIVEKAKSHLSEGFPANISGRVTAADGTPLPGVGVSDGLQIVRTGADGRYRMYSEKKRGSVFVILPSGYEPQSPDGVSPAFFARLVKPYYEAEEHDFILTPVDQRRHSVVFLTDVHLSNDPVRDDLSVFREKTMPFLKHIIDSLRREGPVYAVNLGDFTHELFWGKCNYGLSDGFRTIVEEGFPALMFSIPGNHDNDPSVTGSDTDFRAEHLFREVMGPTYYSMNIGSRHWIMMDNIIYVNTEGEGKKAPGVRGARDYLRGLTEDEMTFLREDLAVLPDSAEVVLCTHCPVLKEKEPGTYHNDPENTAELDRLFARFGKVQVFSGHVHQMQFCDNARFPHMTQRMLPALSGNMWTTRSNPLVCQDGEPAGVFILSSSPVSSGPSQAPAGLLTYRSQFSDGKALRIYDMNAVGDFYRTDPLIRKELETHAGHPDYSSNEYTNYIYVNYWYFRPGETVEILEDGRPLSVERTEDEDPLFTVSFAPVWDGIEGAKIFTSHKMRTSNHMFRARARTRRGTVLVRVRDASGNPLFEERLVRPGSFSREMP